MTSDFSALTTHAPAGLKRIIHVVQQAGGEARIIGGAVRDCLAGLPIRDIDLATNLLPSVVMAALESAAIKVVPTGLAHGTVTAVADHVGYEITTLRRDVATDGRHAEIAYTDDWQVDAGRRDFTMNAMSLTLDGKLEDYFGGREDLAAGRVRFIGHAATRIREDVLRILRYYRFYAFFGGGHDADPDAMRACRDLAALIPTLSVERVWREITKLLSAPNPVPAWRLMREARILDSILPQATNGDRLAALVRLDQAAIDPLLRLVALLPEGADVNELAQRLKLARQDAKTVQDYVALVPALRGVREAVTLRRIMYDYSPALCRAALLLVAAEDAAFAVGDCAPLTALAATWVVPRFPIQGADIVALGLAPSPRIGAILKQVENWWIAADFAPSRHDCLAEAQRRAARDS